MARQYAINDTEWDEVRFINGYALFMGYLMTGVRGLGLLVITWTTVVLLGGFVSDLEKKDFWCLTGITLIQTAGAFNFLLKEKISDTVHSWWGIIFTVLTTFSKDRGVGIKATRIILFVLVAIQVLVFSVILCALGVVYMLGMYISAGVSLWRLVNHDFGIAGGDNQRPALEVLYIIAVAQGVLFGYKTIYALVTGSRLANVVARHFSKVDKELIEEYIEETVAGCEKNLSFASRRNFVTYGVDLMMEAKSNEGFIAGIKVLGGAIKSTYRRGRMVLAKYLLTRSDSSSVIIQRLLETVGPRSPYSREIKEHVVRILDIIAPCIRLEQFPRAIECLCSVVDTSDESRGYGNRFFFDSRYGNRFKDYERVELLEQYEKEYIKYDLRIGSPDFFLGTLPELLYQCLPCKRRLAQKIVEKKRQEDVREVVENKREENIRWGFDRRLVIKATNIIHKLVAHEDNRWILRTCVSSTMLHKIAMLPTKLHRENHHPCRVLHDSELQMLEQCWVITEWLLVAVTETSNPLFSQPATPVGEGRPGRSDDLIEGDVEQRRLILRSMVGSGPGSTIKRTIKDSIESTIKCIFDCLDCRATQKRQAIQILLHLSLDMSLDSESSRRRLSWILLLILRSNHDDSMYWMVPGFTYPNNNSCDFNGIRRLAGEKLSEMLREKHGELPSEESARELQSIHLALGDLKSVFYDGAQDISMRTHAIIIMEGLSCVDYTRYSEVEEFLVGAIPEVVKETLIRCESITAKRQEQATDVEEGNVSQDNQDDCKDSERLRKALVSLCYDGYFSNYYPTMRTKFEEIASKTCEEQGKSFCEFKQLISQSIE